jgi:hypothetical protein
MNPRTNKTIPHDSQSALSHAMPSDDGSAPDVVRVWLLGGFRVSVGSRAIGQEAWRLRKAAALVKLLALAPGHRLQREQAAEALWPNLEFRAASNNLRQALHVARRTLEPDPATASRYLSLSGERLALCPEGQLWVDVGPSKKRRTPPSAPKTQPPTGRPSSSTRASSCQKIATKSGRRAAVESLGRRSYLSWLSSWVFTRSVGRRTRKWLCPSRPFKGC